MSKNVTNFGPVGGDLVVADTIQNSFNRIKDSKVNQDLKSNLEELGKEVAKLLPQVPQADAKEASKAYETITKEATSEEPDTDYFALAASKLLKVAKAVGEVGGPVISMVGTVAKLLGFSIPTI